MALMLVGFLLGLWLLPAPEMNPETGKAPRDYLP
jgi:hypothetical protein